MSTRTAAVRQMVILMRDARGRFARIRATLAERTRRVRSRRRTHRLVLTRGEQLALF